ncbi:MAG TPA: SBBP repeat-containing protein, partial [Thermoanaerobaculia bacterium]|nr:SBBP repeat-containing protein [Thermoanaerobaculia bacterium]
VAFAAAQTSPGFYTLTPCRVLDTRGPTGPYGAPALNANSSRTFVFTGRCGIPATAGAVALNVTVTASSADGDLRIYRGGTAAPMSSSINYRTGMTRANGGTYGLGSNGDLVILVDQPFGSVQVIVDVSGYFVLSGGGGGGTGWSRRFGDVADDRAQAVAVDGSGNVVAAGHLDGTTDFGGGQVSSYRHPSMGPTVDIVVAHYSPSGQYRWARVIGSDSSEEAKGVATDDSGNVLVTGYQGSYAVDYGGGPQLVRAGTDLFVAKYSSAGSWVWSKTIGGYGYDQGNAIAADDQGNVFVTGYIGVSSVGVDFGGGPLSSVGGSDAFLVKYSATGGHVWSKRFGDTGNDNGMAVGADGSGNVFVAGTFEGTVDFGGGRLTSSGLRDVFVAKYSASGQHLWSKRFGGSGDDVAYAIAVDSAGDIALAGKYQGSINFGGGNLSSAGGDDAFLVKLGGGSGSHVWSKDFGAGSGDTATGVAVDGSNNVVVAGYYSGSVDFGGGALSSLGVDVFVAKYSPNGGHMWSRRYGNADSQLADGVAAASNGNVSVAGFFANTIDFGTGTLTTAGVYDGFIASIGP